MGIRGPQPAATRRAGSGPPVLLLHGFAMSHHAWRGVIEDLSQDHDVLAVTLPGHWGGPRVRAREARIPAFVDAIERAMDEAGWSQAHVVGNSLGGWLAFELARRGRALTVTAVAPAGGGPWFGLGTLVLGAKMVSLAPFAVAGGVLGQVGIPEFASRLALRMIVGDRAAVHPRDIRKAIRAGTNCSAFVPMLIAGLVSGGMRHPHEVTVPVRLLHCERDFILPPRLFATYFTERLADVEVALLPGVGHVPMLEAPGLIADEIRGHVRRHALPEALEA